MLPYSRALDFDAIRLALVQAVVMGTGLPEAQVRMAEAEHPDAPRPKAPYVTIMVTSPSVMTGMDWAVPVVDPADLPTGLVTYYGPRSIFVSFDSYGSSHEQAYGVMAGLQSALQTPPVIDLLDAAGLAFYQADAVADASALLQTAFEGRAHMDAEFGALAALVVDAGRIDAADVSGTVDTDTGEVALTIS